MKIIFSICMLLVLTACETPYGDFVVNEKLQFKRKTVFGNTRYINIPTGSYNAKAKIKSKKISLKIDGFKKKVVFKIPSHIDLPTRTANIKLTSSQIGQKYDLNADVIVDTFRSSLRRDNETCQYTRYEHRCRRYCDNQGRCRSICENVPVTYYGYKRVEFYNVTVNRDYELELLTPSTEVIKAVFQGNSSVKFRDYTYQGICR